MIVVSGTFEIAAESVGEALEAAGEMARESRAEPGCISYEFFRDLGNAEGASSQRFRVFEEWESQEALEEHFATGHMGRFRTRLSRVEVLSRDIRRYVVTEVTSL